MYLYQTDLKANKTGAKVLKPTYSFFDALTIIIQRKKNYKKIVYISQVARDNTSSLSNLITAALTGLYIFMHYLRSKP